VTHPDTFDAGTSPDLGTPEDIERALLGARPTLTRQEVADQAGVPLEVATELWHQLGFPHHGDDDVAFTKRDVEALKMTRDLLALGVVDPDSQAALVRTWGRSYARLAEWQTSLLAGVAIDDPDPANRLNQLMNQVLPKVEQLQAYIWRRHLASAASRLAAVLSVGGQTVSLAVCFVDIVGYTSQSKKLDERELVDWLEYFEDELTSVVVDVGGRVIKTIGDEMLWVSDDAGAAAEIALRVTERGENEDDRFPRVRAGIAYGDVVSRLGDVYGPTVNIAARLTSVARPGAVLVDRGVYAAMVSQPVGRPDEEEPVPGVGALIDRLDVMDVRERVVPTPAPDAPYTFRRMRRTSVKGYSRLEPWVLRRA